jgi:hypothetical protein
MAQSCSISLIILIVSIPTLVTLPSSSITDLFMPRTGSEYSQTYPKVK